jgi:molybdopterin adenylyltransferase
MKRRKAAVVTVSSSAYAGKREDISGVKLAEGLSALDFELVKEVVVPDDLDAIVSALGELISRGNISLIATSGGTGLSPDDVTPEATFEVIDREVPGIGEILRTEGFKKTKTAVLSRGIAGVAGKTLIINLPGSPKGVRESLTILKDILHHGLDLIEGKKPH